MKILLFYTVLRCPLSIVLYKWTFLVNEKPARQAMVLCYFNIESATHNKSRISPLKLSKFIIIFANLVETALTILCVAFVLIHFFGKSTLISHIASIQYFLNYSNFFSSPSIDILLKIYILYCMGKLICL